VTTSIACGRCKRSAGRSGGTQIVRKRLPSIDTRGKRRPTGSFLLQPTTLFHSSRAVCPSCTSAANRPFGLHAMFYREIRRANLPATGRNDHWFGQHQRAIAARARHFGHAAARSRCVSTGREWNTRARMISNQRAPQLERKKISCEFRVLSPNRRRGWAPREKVAANSLPSPSNRQTTTNLFSLTDSSND